MGRVGGTEETVLVLDRFDAGRKGTAKDGTEELEPTFVMDDDRVVNVVARTENADSFHRADTFMHSYDGHKKMAMKLRHAIEDVQFSELLHRGWPSTIQLLVNEENEMASATYRTVLPSINLRFVPIYPLRMVPTTLLSDLLDINTSESPFNMGYVTIDQARHVLALLPTDPSVQRLPLVGLWVRNAVDVRDRNVQSACMRYIACRTSLTKLQTGRQNMLLVLFERSGNKVVPKFYECHYEIRDVQLEAFGGSSIGISEDFDGNNGLACTLEVDTVDLLNDDSLCDAYEEVLQITIPRPIKEVEQTPATANDSQAEASVEREQEREQTVSEHPAEGEPVQPPTPPPPPKSPPPTAQSPATVDPARQQQQLYLALLQQQVQFLQTQLANSHLQGVPTHPLIGAPGGGGTPLPVFPFMPFLPTSGPLEPPKPQMCDAGTNTTLVVNDPTKENLDMVRNNLRDATTPPSPPPPNKPTRPSTNACTTTTDLESAVLTRGNLATPTFTLPPDTGSNYAPFFPYKSATIVDGNGATKPVVAEGSRASTPEVSNM
ncbi:hypothetical protein HK104_011348, partial [Borealophlyctis nickersoniae]